MNAEQSRNLSVRSPNLADPISPAPANQPLVSERAMERVIQSVRDASQCEAALAELRSFQASEDTVDVLNRHAEAHPLDSGCAAMALGARMMFNEQLKAYLDDALEHEAEDVIRRFDGSPEAEMIRHATTAMSDYSSNEDLELAHAFFDRAYERADNADEKYPHFRLMRAIAQHRLVERAAMADKARDMEPLRDELNAMAVGRHSSVVLRRLKARFGL